MMSGRAQGWNIISARIFQVVLGLFQNWNNLEYYSKLPFQAERGRWNILFHLPLETHALLERFAERVCLHYDKVLVRHVL